MTDPIICHFLVGLPQSGKTTFAKKLKETIKDAVIVSTDTKEFFFADKPVWSQGTPNEEIKQKAIDEIVATIKLGKPVIYDAANIRRDWRMELLMKIREQIEKTDIPDIHWIAWHLQTPVDVCKERNQQENSIIVNNFIDIGSSHLKTRITKEWYSKNKDGTEKIVEKNKSEGGLKVEEAEGFACVEEISFQKGLQVLPCSNDIDKKTTREQVFLVYRTRLNRSKQIFDFHQYSNILDYERLIHLISLIVEYPSIGNIHNTDPSLVKRILGKEAVIESTIDEISAFMATLKGNVYAIDKDALQRDLDWIQRNQMLGNCEYFDSDIELELYNSVDDTFRFSSVDYYSEAKNFITLIKIIRLVSNQALLSSSDKANPTERKRALDRLADKLVEHNIISATGYKNKSSSYIAEIRKHIELALKPYKILPNKPMRRGYFIGTGIFSKDDLNKLYNLLLSQDNQDYYHDPSPENQILLQKFRENMSLGKLWQEDSPYPVKVIGSKSIINFDKGPNNYIFADLESAIRERKVIQIDIFRQPWDTQKKGKYKIIPLQIVFHLFAWYLGYEIIDGEQKGLFKFERIDRLRIDKSQRFKGVSEQEQEKLLKRLNILYQCSAGIYLGESAKDQKGYLSEPKKFKKTLKIYVTEESFKFLSETASRFPQGQMTMSIPSHLEGTINKKTETVYKLKKDLSQAPHVHQIKIDLPKWAIEDIYLIKWLVPWGRDVKVVEPEELVKKIMDRGNGIHELYSDRYADS